MSHIEKNPSFLAAYWTLSPATSVIFSNRSSYRQRSASRNHWITPVKCLSSLLFTYLSIPACLVWETYTSVQLHVSRHRGRGQALVPWVRCSVHPVDVLLSSIRGRFRSFGVDEGSYPSRQHAISLGRPSESSWSFRSCYCSSYLHAAKVLTSLLTRDWCFLRCRLLLCSCGSLLARCKDVHR